MTPPQHVFLVGNACDYKSVEKLKNLFEQYGITPRINTMHNSPSGFIVDAKTAAINFYPDSGQFWCEDTMPFVSMGYTPLRLAHPHGNRALKNVPSYQARAAEQAASRWMSERHDIMCADSARPDFDIGSWVNVYLQKKKL